MNICVVDVEPNYYVICTDDCIQKQGGNFVKYFFGHDDEIPNFNLRLSKNIRMGQSSLHIGILLAEFGNLIISSNKNHQSQAI